MATRKTRGANKEAAERKERVVFHVKKEDLEVSHVHEFKGSDACPVRIGFSLTIQNAVFLHNLVACETAEGKQFISFPSYKGANGQYYDYYYISFGENATEDILQMVFDALED